MQFRRARFLSFESMTYQGDSGVSVASNMASLALEKSYQRRCDSTSIGLSFQIFQPVFDQDNAILNDEMLSNGGILEEFLVLLVGAEAHHMLDARPIIPTAVENDDFACCGKMSHIALEVHLRFLALCWLG